MLDKLSNFTSSTHRIGGAFIQGTDERQEAGCVQGGRIDVDETARSLPYQTEEESDIEEALRLVGDLRI